MLSHPITADTETKACAAVGLAFLATLSIITVLKDEIDDGKQSVICLPKIYSKDLKTILLTSS